MADVSVEERGAALVQVRHGAILSANEVIPRGALHIAHRNFEVVLLFQIRVNGQVIAVAVVAAGVGRMVVAQRETEGVAGEVLVDVLLAGRVL